MGTHPTALYTGRIYPGLRPFDVDDAVLFFGRDEQTDELLRRLDDTRFLAVVGLSGSGKSSLVRAGLLPALHRGNLTGAGARWQVSILRPGSDPLQALARVLNETLGERDDRLAMLRSSRLGLLDTSRQGRNADENLLLVVDQFEEIFRFQDSYRQRANEAADFVELLLAAAQEYERAYRVYVVVTLRSDYLGECARFRGLPEALNESQYLVPRMAREQLREAIEGPAALGGVALSKELQEELLERTSDDPDQLSVLQHLLMRMWEIRESDGAGFSIGRDQYKSVGSWDEALNSHADTVWEALGDRRDLAKRMLQRLTEKAQAGREVRRPATVRELAQVGEVDADEVKKVVEHFRRPGCNFLTSPDRELTENSVIDISHESLIRRWKQLNDWTTEEADWGAWYRRVEDRVGIGGAYLVDPELQSALQARDMGRWNEVWAKRYQAESDGIRPAYGDVIRFLDESKKKRSGELARLQRTRVIIAATAVLFAALFLLATYFWFTSRQQYRNAARQKLVAEQNQRVAETAKNDALAAKNREEQAKNDAVNARAVAETARSQASENAAVAQRAARESKARELAAFSAESLNNDPEESILLGMQAVNATLRFGQPPVPAAEEALHQAILSSQVRVTLRGHSNSVTAVAFSPDGKRLATASVDETAKVWDAESGKELRTLRGHSNQVLGVAFSPDGKRLATASVDDTARVWDAESGKELLTLRGHSNYVTAVAFSPDGKRLATASNDDTAKVWDAESGKELRPWPATQALLALWPSAPMASASPPPVTTIRRRCGTRRAGRNC